MIWHHLAISKPFLDCADFYLVIENPGWQKGKVLTFLTTSLRIGIWRQHMADHGDWSSRHRVLMLIEAELLQLKSDIP